MKKESSVWGYNWATLLLEREIYIRDLALQVGAVSNLRH
jgi:hypothetical protein